MLNDIAIGQFFPGRSILHKTDPRVKIALVALLIIVIFMSVNFYALGLSVFFVVMIMILSQIPMKMYFKGLKSIFALVLFTSILNVFYAVDGNILLEIGSFKLYDTGLYNALFVTLRIVCLILTSSTLTFTTSPSDLTDGIERLLKPLTLFKIPVHEFAMMMTIALRFIPTLLEETEKITNAQKARGADLETGNIFTRVKAMLPIFIPLFISSIRRAYDLATAMECRCYQGGNNRTRLKVLKLNLADFCVMLVVFLFSSGVIFCNYLF